MQRDLENDNKSELYSGHWNKELRYITRIPRLLFLKAYLYKFIPFVRFHSRQKLIQPIRMGGTAVFTRGSTAIQRQRKPIRVVHRLHSNGFPDLAAF